MEQVNGAPAERAEPVNRYGRVVAARLDPDVRALLEVAVTASGQTISSWLRETIWRELERQMPYAAERIRGKAAA